MAFVVARHSLSYDRSSSKLVHALRSSRETELAQDFPIHVVTAWLGNTPTIALLHYLLTIHADFERAAGGKTHAEKLVQIPVQQAKETGCIEQQPENGNREISKENEMLQLGAASQSGELRNRTTYKFAGKLALRHHARREIQRAHCGESHLT